MKDHEFLLLATGFALGCEVMLLLQLIFNMVDDRRARRRLQSQEAAQRRRRAADTWRDAIPRDVQADLHACIDRLEDGLRADGVLPARGDA